MTIDREPARHVNVAMDMPEEMLDGLMQLREIDRQETLGSLVQLACSEYIEKRKSEPDFEDRVRAALARPPRTGTTETQ